MVTEYVVGGDSNVQDYNVLNVNLGICRMPANSNNYVFNSTMLTGGF